MSLRPIETWFWCLFVHFCSHIRWLVSPEARCGTITSCRVHNKLRTNPLFGTDWIGWISDADFKHTYRRLHGASTDPH